MKIKTLWLFYRERFVSLFFNITVLLDLIAAVIIALRQPTYNASNTLHYNRFYGIDQVGSWVWMWVYLAVVIAISILNFLFAYRTYTRDKYLSYYVLTAGAITSAGFLLYILLIGPFL
jgi:hypothetical protein